MGFQHMHVLATEIAVGWVTHGLDWAVPVVVKFLTHVINRKLLLS